MATIGLSKVFILDKYFTELQKFWETERKVQGTRHLTNSPHSQLRVIITILSFFLNWQQRSADFNSRPDLFFPLFVFLNAISFFFFIFSRLGCDRFRNKSQKRLQSLQIAAGREKRPFGWGKKSARREGMRLEKTEGNKKNLSFCCWPLCKKLRGERADQHGEEVVHGARSDVRVELAFFVSSPISSFSSFFLYLHHSSFFATKHNCQGVYLFSFFFGLCYNGLSCLFVSLASSARDTAKNNCSSKISDS